VAGCAIATTVVANVKPSGCGFGHDKLILHGKDTRTHIEKFPAGLALTLNNLPNRKFNGSQLAFMWILRLKAGKTTSSPTPNIN